MAHGPTFPYVCARCSSATRFFLFNLCAPASKGGQGMKVLGIVDGLGRDNVEHLKRLATNADSLALNGSVFSAVSAVSKTVRSSVKSAYGVGSSVKTNLVKVVPLWRESKRVVTVAEKGGGAPREQRRIIAKGRAPRLRACACSVS